MKKLKQIISQIKTLSAGQAENLNPWLWQLICYSPKMPLRSVQEPLLNESTEFSLKVQDEYFAKNEVVFKGFKWGEGKNKY